MRTYCFNVPIIGNCNISVEANSLEEAINKVKSRESLIYELDDWSTEIDNNDIESYWSNKNDFKGIN